MLLLEEEEDLEGGEFEDALSGEFNSLQLSLCSMTGFTSHKSWKMKGSIQDQAVVVLIDCGASHSFISKKLVKELLLPVENTPSYTVEVGDGYKIGCKGKCSNLKLMIQSLEVTQDFYLFGLNGIDLVLGLDWLASLGDIKANFSKMRLSLKKDGHWFTLEGDPALTRSELSYGALMQTLLGEGEGLLIHCEQGDTTGQKNITIPADLVAVLAKFDSVFQDPQGLPPRRRHDHAIHLKEGADIPNLRPYKCPHYQKNEIEKLVAEMLEGGVIRPSISPYSSPIILVKKKDGGWRFCVDFRALNKITIPNKFPIPIIEELLDEIGGAKVFSKLDLKSGYHQIRMKEEDIEKTAFRTHEGHYEFLVMPFGLTNAPSTFQALMNEVLKPYLRKFALVFFDDILVYSPDLSAHSEHLHLVLSLLEQNSLMANRKKCTFGQTSLEYLGHTISGAGVAAEQSKVEAIKDWPIPREIKGLRGFLGLTGYYRRFVQNYGKIAKPLTDLLKKEGFKWTPAATEAFDKLKTAMINLPLLAVPDFSKQFVVETDASSKELGAVLMQEGRPLAFWSKGLSPRAQQKSVYERELMALVQAIQKWRHYLLGRHFVIKTDQRSLKFLNDQRLFTDEQFKWAVKLVGLDFEIQYKPGSENSAADALSRKMMYSAISVISAADKDEWNSELHQDPKVAKLIQDLLISPTSHSGYSFKNGFLYYKDRLVLPKNSNRIPMILSECHATPMGGHSGHFRTYKKIASFLYWEGMKADIRKFVEECDICQRNKYSTLAPGGLLQPLPIPTEVWMDISMDFVGGLPRVRGKDTIFVVVDRLSKFAHFFALGHPFTAKDVALIFIKEVVKLHGFPTTIISDRDPLFLSQFWKEIFRLAGTQLKLSTSYHPQTDGQTEVVNRCLETYLRCFVGPKPKQWLDWLSWAEFWFNTNFHGSAGMSPFRALYGRDPPILLKAGAIPSRVEEVNQLFLHRDAILEELKGNLTKAQNQMKLQADKHRRNVEFKEGDWVYLKIQPYKLKSLASRPFAKLAPRFYGPYQILSRVGPVAYKLELPLHARIHAVFHVSLLKKALKPDQQPHPLPPMLNEELELEVTPAEVKATREDAFGNLEVLVSWDTLPSCDNSWESAAKIQELFPSFPLEDKVKLLGGSIDRFKRVYSRRRTQE